MPEATAAGAEPAESRARIGAVVIGRNEGERLRRCLASLAGRVERVVYVDSGSTDGSVALARSLGCEVVELDPARAFSMARARNAGFARLCEGGPRPDLVQFVDGDCELAEGWLAAARAELAVHPRAVVACGRRRERHPERSVFDRLVDMEWEAPTGSVEACGGDALMRAAALARAGGFDEAMIAGEERELCHRLRGAGGEVRRIAAEMTLHDANIRRFGQWWRRCERTGHAYAEGARKTRDVHNVHARRSALVWGLGFPAVLVALAALAALGVPAAGVGAVLVALAWPTMALWIGLGRSRRGRPLREGLLFGVFCLIAKPAQTLGIARYEWSRLRRRPSELIEYK